MKGTKGLSTKKVWRYLSASGAFAALAACTGGSHGAPLDSMPDGPTERTITLQLTSADNLRLIAFRDGPTAPWQIPAATAPARYEFVAHGPYTVLDTCTLSGAGIAITLEQSRTLDDPTDVDMSCLIIEGSGRADSEITGSMSPSGDITVGGLSVQVEASGQFNTMIEDGTYDVIARTRSSIAAEDRIAIRRNVVVAGDTVVTPTIDLATEGIASVLIQPTIPNADAGESVQMLGDLFTSHGSTIAQYAGIHGVHLLPTAALGPGDHQEIVVDARKVAGSTSWDRLVFRDHYTESTSVIFTLPPAIAVQYTMAGAQLVASWTALPPFDSLEFSAYQVGATNIGDIIGHVVDLTPSYVAATGATSAALEVDVPGFDPAWRIDTTHEWDAIVQTTRSDGDTSMVSAQSDVFTP